MWKIESYSWEASGPIILFVLKHFSLGSKVAVACSLTSDYQGSIRLKMYVSILKDLKYTDLKTRTVKNVIRASRINISRNKIFHPHG